MKTIKQLFITISLTVALAIAGCGNTSNSSQNHKACELSFNENVSTEETLFNHVKNNAYCSVYHVMVASEDQYGNTVWKRYYTCTDFTKDEYEEMRKYQTIRAYLENVPGRTKNERGNSVNKWTFVEDKEK